MSKKRDRRFSSSSTRPPARADSSAQRDDLAKDGKLVPIFVLFFIVSPVISILVYHFRFASPSHSTESEVERGPVKADLNYQEILTGHSKVIDNGSPRRYTYPVLAYVTPWNSRGYELAKRFNSKFTHLSPVWYDLKSQKNSLVLEGRHNADIGWISELRKEGDALILPRVVLEALPSDLLRKKQQRKTAIDLIVTECKVMGYDGIVLESWSRWAAYGVLHNPSTRNLVLQFIKQLGDALHSVISERNNRQQLQLVFVIGTLHSEKLQQHDFGPKDLERLDSSVDGFSLMTYDFSSPHNPGPNAPLKWIYSTLRLLLGTHGKGAHSMAHKIFLGINFYGNDFTLSRGLGGGAIIGRDYLSLLEKYEPQLQWEKNSAEHFFFYSDGNDIQHVVFYPSLLSISMRLEEARSWGCSISIWEIGQGLDYFFGLL